MDRQMRLLGCLFLTLSCLVVSPALAQPITRTFALVIANNRSTDGQQPDLQYADDDGARYQRLFLGLAEPEDVLLLTSFDRATRAQYGEQLPIASAPSAAQLLAARDKLAANIQAARAHGERTRLYLVYAGHGEMIEGRGYLHLEDRQIDGEFIERELLGKLSADDTHVILDSCNSFFVMNPRKPGGRRWATPQDMAFGFSARHPEVGLFLSTNSESEVFEWSELESGVFSHEVRSGLSGGADVDDDGTVSYLELAGFVDSANRGIARESLRPHLFFRGPHGDRNAALFPSRALRGRRVKLAQPATRLWIKNQQGERLLDLHKEDGPMTVVLPGAANGELSLYVENNPDGQRVVITEHEVDAGDEPVALADLPAHVPELSARGRRLFGTLFAEAFGPVALGRFGHAEDDKPEPVFGLTDVDLVRMQGFLQQIAAEGRSRRAIMASYSIGLGVISGSASIALASQGQFSDTNKIALTAGVSAGFLGLGLYRALHITNGERALLSFEHELKAGDSRGARAFAQTELWLARMATRERRVRRFTLWASQTVALTLAAAGTVRLVEPAHGTEEHHERAINCAMLFSTAAFTSVYGAMLGLRKSAPERMLELYHDDPALKLHLTGSVGPHAAGFGLGGSF